MSDSPSFFSRAWSFTKSYVSNVAYTYLEFAIPVAIFLAFNASAEQQLRDNEKLGLLYMHYAQMENNVERETRFPVHPPESAAQRKRLQAAHTAEAATSI